MKAQERANAFLVSGLSLPFDAEDNEFLHIAGQKMKRMGISPDMLHFQIHKKSIDFYGTGRYNRHKKCK